MPGEEGGPPSCFGNSGAFTVVHDGQQRRVVSGLPSFGDQGTGDNAVGPSDVLADQYHPVGLIGGGGDVADRASLGKPGGADRLDGQVQPALGTGLPVRRPDAVRDHRQPGRRRDRLRPVRSDRRYGSLVVADAAGNDVLRVHHTAQISTLAVFPATQVPAPPFLQLPAGSMIPMQAVPTTVAVRQA